MLINRFLFDNAPAIALVSISSPDDDMKLHTLTSSLTHSSSQTNRTLRWRPESKLIPPPLIGWLELLEIEYVRTYVNVWSKCGSPPGGVTRWKNTSLKPRSMLVLRRDKSVGTRPWVTLCTSFLLPCLQVNPRAPLPITPQTRTYTCTCTHSHTYFLAMEWKPNRSLTQR